MAENAAIVTGGSGGIGQAISQSLLARGMHVCNLDLLPSPLAHERLTNYEIDLSDMAATTECAAGIVNEHNICTFVHNVGVIRPALISDIDPNDFDYLTSLHLKAALVLLQACLPSLKAAPHPRVVLIASRAALGLPTRSAYSATKAGVIGLTRTWALELAPERITVNAIAPGPIADTGMFHEVIPQDSEQMRALGASLPLGRLGKPDDVAHAVDFFVAPQASFVTGQVLYVCGGSSVGSLAL
jgi:3-oxoacyl-[acyl-carrier protein] reductase